MGTIYSVWLQQLNLSDYVKKQILLIEKSCQSIYEASYKDYKEWGLSHQAAIVLEESKKELNLSETILKQCNR